MDISEVYVKVRDLLSLDSSGHDFEHTMRVNKTALDIAKSYPEADKDLITLIALLHDVDDPKIFNTENNENARKIMESQKLDKSLINSVIAGINEISFSKNKDKKPSTIEAQIVQDADRLDAIGAIGVARTFAFGGSKGRSLGSSINHFHEKLLLLKDMMNTEVAKKMAEKRHDFLLDFLEEYEKEIK